MLEFSAPQHATPPPVDRAQAWRERAVIATVEPAAETDAGTLVSPKAPLPKHATPPPSERLQEKDVPTATETCAVLRNAGGAHCPALLSPQQRRPPAERMAHVCSSPREKLVRMASEG